MFVGICLQLFYMMVQTCHKRSYYTLTIISQILNSLTDQKDITGEHLGLFPEPHDAVRPSNLLRGQATDET